MGLMVLFGCMFLAYAPAVATFFYLVRKSPKLVIVTVTRFVKYHVVYLFFSYRYFY